MIVPALPVPLWVFNPFKYNPQKGLKPTEEEALPPDLLIRLLKQTAKERMRGRDCRYPIGQAVSAILRESGAF